MDIEILVDRYYPRRLTKKQAKYKIYIKEF